MGVFGKLFGRSEATGSGDARCNECGMTGGRHTDWCPLAQEEEKPTAAEGAGKTPPEGKRPGGGKS